MTRRMTSAEAQSGMAGCRALKERERDELQNESHQEKFKALAFLMACTDLFDLSQFDAEDAAARARWTRLQSLLLDR